MNILEIFALVGGLYNILIFVILILIYRYISFKYDFSLIEQSVKIIDPETNQHNLDFEKFINVINGLYSKIEEKKSFSESEFEYYYKILAIDEYNQVYNFSKIKSSAMYKFFPKELVCEIKEYLENESKNKFVADNLSNNQFKINDYASLIKKVKSKSKKDFEYVENKNNEEKKKNYYLNKLDFLRLKTLYQIFRFKIRKRISLNYFESFVYIFFKCLGCCKLRQKVNCIDHASDVYFEEKNLTELMYYNKDFINLKGMIFDKDQNRLFNSLPIEKIEYKDTQALISDNIKDNLSDFNDSQYLTSKNNKVSELHSKSTFMLDDQNYASDDERVKNNFDLKQSNYYKRMVSFYDSLVIITSKNKTETSEKILNMLNIPTSLKDDLIDEVNKYLIKKINSDKNKIKDNEENKNYSNQSETEDTLKESDIKIVLEKFGNNP